MVLEAPPGAPALPVSVPLADPVVFVLVFVCSVVVLLVEEVPPLGTLLTTVVWLDGGVTGCSTVCSQPYKPARHSATAPDSNRPLFFTELFLLAPPPDGAISIAAG